LVPTEMWIRPSCLTRGPLRGIALALIGASHPFPNKRSALFVVAVPESLQLLFNLRDKPIPSMLKPHSPSDKDKPGRNKQDVDHVWQRQTTHSCPLLCSRFAHSSKQRKEQNAFGSQSFRFRNAVSPFGLTSKKGIIGLISSRQLWHLTRVI